MNTITPTPVNIIRDQHGTIMIEFAASMILLLVLYLGMITLGLRINESIAMQKVVRDGAREVAITSSLSQGEAKALESAWVWGLEPNKVQINFSTYDYGARKLIDCNIRYVSSPFSKVFPTLVGEKPIDERVLEAEATYGWWDVAK